jgi:hypothetical protein
MSSAINFPILFFNFIAFSIIVFSMLSSHFLIFSYPAQRNSQSLKNCEWVLGNLYSTGARPLMAFRQIHFIFSLLGLRFLSKLFLLDHSVRLCTLHSKSLLNFQVFKLQTFIKTQEFIILFNFQFSKYQKTLRMPFKSSFKYHQSPTYLG